MKLALCLLLTKFIGTDCGLRWNEHRELNMNLLFDIKGIDLFGTSILMHKSHYGSNAYVCASALMFLAAFRFTLPLLDWLKFVVYALGICYFLCYFELVSSGTE